ncbi:MAG: radical SAM protein, partial [Planctomycetes bacterium]|nr:radical SAM protein [Planctomycetota bacterium]
SCEFCPDSRMTRERGVMSLEMARSIIDNVRRTGIVKLIVLHVMGEPTLHPDLVEIAEYANSKSVSVCITTNGIQLKQDMLHALIKARVKQIILSLQTPDEKTFSMRGVKGLSFTEYAEHITSIAGSFVQNGHETGLTINFLSSPLRKLIIPVAREFKIADTSKELRYYLKAWAGRILKSTNLECRLPQVQKQINRAKCFKENTVVISDRVSFYTRIVGDWATHFDQKNVNARFGYCPGIQENFGILWNGDYTFCCTDHNGMTSTCNYRDTSLYEYLKSELVQNIVKGFKRYRVLHPYCKQCLGDKNILNAIVKQIGSIVYFKLIKKN